MYHFDGGDGDNNHRKQLSWYCGYHSRVHQTELGFLC